MVSTTRGLGQQRGRAEEREQEGAPRTREDGGEVRVDDGGAERRLGPVGGRVQRRPRVHVAALHQVRAAAALHEVPARTDRRQSPHRRTGIRMHVAQRVSDPDPHFLISIRAAHTTTQLYAEHMLEHNTSLLVQLSAGANHCRRQTQQ